MGVLLAVMGLPIEVHRDPSGEAVVGRAACRVTAGTTPVEVRAVSVALVDAFGAGGRRRATGVAVPGLLVPQPAVYVRAGTAAEISVWFEPLALGSVHDCRVVVELLIDGQRVLVASEAVVRDDGPSLAR
jgi:hypothetical protein